MTSSATRTEAGEVRRRGLPGGRQDLWIGGALLAAGWLLVFYIHHWHFSAPVFFLWAGWAAVLAIGRFLWQAGVAAAVEGEEGEDEGFDLTATHREELEREKKALLKAIKEVEFDRSMGKMSEEDADEIVRFYRARAIEILKQIERLDSGGTVDRERASIEELVDHEVQARLTLLRAAGRKGKGKGR